jgi:glucosyl-dolichyl phosphate glucuronosyltransferase
MKPVQISVIVCTRDRTGGLVRALESLLACRVPPGLAMELVVVDNGTEPGVHNVVRQLGRSRPELRCVVETRPGLSNARNTGVRASRGDILLFMDDDEIADPLWVENMTKPLMTGDVHGVTGRIATAPHLLRDWMTPRHRELLSETIQFGEGTPDSLVGGNMGIRREVFQIIPGFDPELGAGTRLGYCEETVFSWQMKEAGLRLGWAYDANVVHHFSADRLLRCSWLKMAEQRGRTMGFLDYHWYHSEVRFLSARLARARARYRLQRILHGRSRGSEGCPWWEIRATRYIAVLKQFRIERRRARKFAG